MNWQMFDGLFEGILRGIEGGAQRVPEDTMRFVRIVEGPGVSFMRSLV